MSRLQPYRVRMPVQILKTMDVASRITLFLVGQTGPLCFTFKDRLDQKWKVSIGAELKCTCAPNKHDHCIHTLYILLKIFKVSPQNPIIWQAAYVDSQLSDLLSGKHTVTTSNRVPRQLFMEEENDLPSDNLQRHWRAKSNPVPASNNIDRMDINQESTCPICQENMNKDMCLTYCKLKCGNNFHLECLKIWAEHKKSHQSTITCPMCRCPFGHNFIQDLEHEEREYRRNQLDKIKLIYKCSSCGVDNIPKNVYKCLLCTSYQLCETCFHNNKHIKHPFIKQEYNIGKWRGAEERREAELKMKNYIDSKRREQSVNQQLIQKLRKIEEDPSKLLDFVASAYPYVSKYISDNVDPLKKLDLNPEDMKCMKCSAKKMLFLRRLTCGHFIDHECLKENLRKGKFHCDLCGVKIVKGYENLVNKEKQMQVKKQVFVGVSQQFNPQRMEAQNLEYNFISNEEPTLTELVRGEGNHQEANSRRLRHRFSSNIVRGSIQNTGRNQNNSQERRLTFSRRQVQSREGTHIRIRNIPKPSIKDKAEIKKKEDKRKDMAQMLEAMIGRKVF